MRCYVGEEQLGNFGVILGLLFVSLRRLVRFCEYTGRYEWKAMLALMIYFILIGTTEAIPTMYHRELFTVFLFVVISSLKPDFRR